MLLQIPDGKGRRWEDSCKRTSVRDTKRMDKKQSENQLNKNEKKMAYLPTAVHAASKSIWEGEKMGGQLQADESTRNEKNGQNIYIDSCKRTSVQETKRMDKIESKEWTKYTHIDSCKRTSVQETKRMEKIESKDQWNRNQNKMAYLPAVLLLLLLPRSSRCTTTTAGLYLLGSQSSFYYAAIAACGLASIRRPCGFFLRFFCVIFFSFFFTSRCCLVIEGSIKVLSESIPVHYLLR